VSPTRRLDPAFVDAALHCRALYERHKPSDGATSVGDHDVITDRGSLDVLRQPSLQFSDSDLHGDYNNKERDYRRLVSLLAGWPCGALGRFAAVRPDVGWMMPRLDLHDVYDLCLSMLVASGSTPENAAPAAAAMRDAEAQGMRTHGFEYIPYFCEHLRNGKINGRAVPSVAHRADSALVVDADHGFAHTAFLFALDEFVAMTKRSGTASLGITRSYSASVVGWFVEHLADHDLVSLAFANASPLMPSWGGSTARFGTNPLGFGVPRAGTTDEPIVVDMATSTVARVNVIAAAKRGEELPIGWALDKHGQPTTDPEEALAGMNAPLGGAKGYGLAMMVDVLAAGLTGANFSMEASGLLDNEGGPPGVGQLFVAFDPNRFGIESFDGRIDAYANDITAEPGVRLPGDRRHQKMREASENGVEVSDELLEHLRTFLNE
jgi:(2R)-3-sulfolactate dehydrogenase (NADP+)